MDNLLCSPATINLSGAEIELVSLVARENRLRNAIRDYLAWREEQGMARLDYVLIDCPPSLGLLTVNALVAAREVLIPIQAEYYALEGLTLLLNNIELIRQHLNPQLQVSSILLTMRSEEHTSELQSRGHLVCRLLLEKKKQKNTCNSNI